MNRWLKELRGIVGTGGIWGTAGLSVGALRGRQAASSLTAAFSDRGIGFGSYPRPFRALLRGLLRWHPCHFGWPTIPGRSLSSSFGPMGHDCGRCCCVPPSSDPGRDTRSVLLGEDDPPHGRPRHARGRPGIRDDPDCEEDCGPTSTLDWAVSQAAN